MMSNIFCLGYDAIDVIMSEAWIGFIKWMSTYAAWGYAYGH